MKEYSEHTVIMISPREDQGYPSFAKPKPNDFPEEDPSLKALDKRLDEIFINQNEINRRVNEIINEVRFNVTKNSIVQLEKEHSAKTSSGNSEHTSKVSDINIYKPIKDLKCSREDVNRKIDEILGITRDSRIVKDEDLLNACKDSINRIRIRRLEC